jgi:hypothetical protein
MMRPWQCQFLSTALAACLAVMAGTAQGGALNDKFYRAADGKVDAAANKSPEAAPAAEERPGCASARQTLSEALCLPQSAFCADTPLAPLAIDSLIMECIALHAEDMTGLEYDRADICALATVRDLELLLFSPQPRRASWSSS